VRIVTDIHARFGQLTVFMNGKKSYITNVLLHSLFIFLLNIAVEWVALLFRVLEVPGSGISLETAGLTEGVRGHSQPPG
jgi:hypothetical protein